MIICAAGDIHGALDRMYTGVLAFEAALGVRFEWVLHVGDFGVWPDPNRIDKATKQLITSVRPGQPDTELRFIEPTADDVPRAAPRQARKKA